MFSLLTSLSPHVYYFFSFLSVFLQLTSLFFFFFFSFCCSFFFFFFFFFFQAEDGIRDLTVTGVQTCALPISVRLDFDFGENVTLTSISAYESTESSSRGDIDGGFGADFLGNAAPCPPGGGPVCIPFPSDTLDAIDDLDQITQEFRLANQASDALFWQAGLFYFDSDFSVTTNPFFVPPST